jgi:RNA polymerase sigma factor (sigma-70 family)
MNELLHRYVTDGSEPAFTELVRQHIGLVYSAALRQVNGDAAAAEDVTQAVFANLARNAPRLVRHTSLPGWLYTSTRYQAAKARRADGRRRAREQQACAMNQVLHADDSDPVWHELRPVLDEVIHELKVPDREAVLMRYFERLPLAEVGVRLGLSENTARMKVERALDKLRAALARRGVTSSTAALAGLLTQQAVGAVPAGLASSVAQTALASAGASAGIALTSLNVAAMSKLQAGIAAVVIVAGLATTLVIRNQAVNQRRADNDRLRQQSGELAQAQAEHERLSELATLANGTSPNNQTELLRLRDQAAKLRTMVALQRERDRLTTEVERAREEVQKNNKDTDAGAGNSATEAASNYATELAGAMMNYAYKQNNHLFPTNLEQVAPLMPPQADTNLTPARYEIAYAGTVESVSKFAHPDRVILLRERQPWLSSDGRWVITWASLRGGNRVHFQADDDFDAWAQQHTAAPEAPEQ